MKNFKFLLDNIEIKSITGETDRTVSSIQYDSRKCTENSLFVALRGVSTDGHAFIEQAINNGAKTIVCEEFPETIDKSYLTVVIVENTRETLARLSHQWYDNPTKDIRVIGVTGTNGKTTVTYLMKALFESFGEKTGIIGTTGVFFGNEKIGATHTTPESLELAEIFRRMKNAGVKNVIMEVSSHALNQHRADCVNFDSAFFTNLTHDHLDYHKTMDQYASAKKRLFNMLKNDGTAIVFDNSQFSEYMIQDTLATNKFTIGRKETSDFVIKNESLDLFKSTYNLHISESTGLNIRDITLETKLAGRFNIDNTAIAATWFLFKGYPSDKVREYLILAEGAPGRMQRIALKNGAIALVDYAHTPDALEKALLSCREILKTTGNETGRIISVFGCGGDRDKTKRPEMGKISSEIADFSFITSDNPRTEDPESILRDIFSGISAFNKVKCKQIINRLEAIEKAVEFSEKGDIILLAGKGHENYQIIGKQKTHFDDAEELNRINN